MNRLNNIEKILSKYKNKVALIIDDKKITYSELLFNSKKMATNLKHENTNNVIVYGHKEPYMIYAFFACLMEHKTYIPIDISVPKERIDLIIKDSKSKLIITEYENTFGLKKISMSKIKFNKKIVKNNSDIAYIMYTSGSTGVPKGVPINRNNLENFIKWISNSYLKKYKNINVFNQANYNFDLSVADIYYSIFNGHTLVTTNKNMIENFDYLFNLIKNNNINLFVATPTFIKLLLINKNFNLIEFSNLKSIYFCGEILESQLVQKIRKRFKKIEIINAYGPTEATSAVSIVKITKIMQNYDKLPVGKMSKNACNIFLENSEIVLNGKSVFKGYLNSNEEIKDYRTGDYGFIKNNLLYFNGRKDEIIKYKGYRIELNDIRNNILNISNVIDVQIKPIYKNNIVINLFAYVVGNDINEKSIKEKLMQKIPNYMIPNRVFVLDEIVYNENFKSRRK